MKIKEFLFTGAVMRGVLIRRIIFNRNAGLDIRVTRYNKLR